MTRFLTGAARIGLIGAAALGLAACQTQPVVPAYQVSRDSLFYLHQSGARPVSVGAFEGVRFRDPFMVCLRMARIPGPDELDYPGFIRDALITELRTARLFSENATGVVLTGELEWLTVTQVTPHNGRWNIQLTLRSSNGSEVSARERFRFETGGLVGPRGCQNATKALPVAVRRLLEQIITSRDFRTLLNAPPTAS